MLQDQQTEFKMVRVPVSIRYQYQGRIVKPHASVGLSFYYENDGVDNTLILDLLPNISLGVSVKVYNEIYLTISHERDFYANPEVNNSNSSTFSQSTSVGVMLRL